MGAGDDGLGVDRLEKGRPGSPGEGIEVLKILALEVGIFLKKRPEFRGRKWNPLFGDFKLVFH